MSTKRRAWSLQARLMTAVIGVVTLMFAGVALATGALLGAILQDSLDVEVAQSRPFSRVGPLSTASEVLTEGRQAAGTVLILRVPGGLSGAYVAEDGSIVALPDDTVSEVSTELSHGGIATVDIDGLGEYRLMTEGETSGIFAAYGLPTSQVSTTLASIGTTVALVTTAGLLSLGVVIALVIRRSLRPLRAVADTAQRVARIPLAEGSVSISERVPEDQADPDTEIGRVGDALNTLLDHVDSSLDARQKNEDRMRRFVADASHELRTPLASIRGYSELSLRALQKSPTADAGETTQTSLERIQAQSLRMTALVEDLLLLARLEEGQELVHGTVDLTRVAVESLGDAQVAGRGHEWELDLDDNPVVVRGDEHRIHQVVVNLLANARTHTPEGTRVTVAVTQEGEHAILRVHDNGPGIDSSIVNELFERFARADTSRARQTGGTGLGLSIARAIVDAHDGTISVDSIPGDTTFTVRFPLVQNTSGQEHQEHQEHQETT